MKANACSSGKRFSQVGCRRRYTAWGISRGSQANEFKQPKWYRAKLHCLPLPPLNCSSGFRLEMKQFILEKKKKQTATTTHTYPKTKPSAYLSIPEREKSQETLTLAGTFDSPKDMMVAHAHGQFFHSSSWHTEQDPQLLLSDVPEQPATCLLLQEIPLVSQAGNIFYTS